ncbi:uncharacterized protein PAC_12547 [Phialocephala subalpina]|uniref:Uncharacterized protein n=1 Tax=Phialocephala subalpina TaxID=576137 RepID=A0A1L7XC78_9HELO|nr:uncharacterized protein PAC_12547 [Phialocephala subalpina]
MCGHQLGAQNTLIADSGTTRAFFAFICKKLTGSASNQVIRTFNTTFFLHQPNLDRVQIHFLIMKLTSSLSLALLSLWAPLIQATSSPRHPYPFRRSTSTNATFPNATSPNATISTPPFAFPNGTFPNATSTTVPLCPLTNTTNTTLPYTFTLRAVSDHTTNSIFLISNPYLASTFHISDASTSLAFFSLEENGQLFGTKNGHIGLAGLCSLLRSGAGNGTVYIPSCAYNGTVNPFPVSNKKWVAKSACVDGETELILLPDFGDGTVVRDTYFHAVPGAEPLIFHAQQEIYPTAILVIQKV